MKLQGIEHFITIADAGSIRAAARQLGVSQPALTRSLQALEKELGVQLMLRGVHGISLTPEGSTFAARARIAQNELGKAAEEVRRGVDDAGGLLTIGLSPVASSLLLPELVINMRAAFPKTRLRIMETSPSALLSMVRDTAVEMAVAQRSRAFLDAGLRYRPLFDIQLRIAARPGHPLAGRRELHELAGADWLAATAPGNPDDIVVRSMIGAGLPEPRRVVHCGSHHLLIDMAASTDMLMQVPPNQLRPLVESGRLIEISLTRPLLPLRVGLYTRADSQPTRAGKAAAQFIGATARRYAATGELRNAEPFAAPRARRAI